jgi:hypothetical protein
MQRPNRDYLDGIATCYMEAAGTSDLRTWETLAGVLRHVRKTIQEIERESAKT